MAAERLPHEKGFHVSWDQIHRDARALAWRMDGKGPGEGGAGRPWSASRAAASSPR
jgi:xanthine phosphoribosyltransferase